MNARRFRLAVTVALMILSLLGTRPAVADETCQSPFLPKVTGQEDYVYVWTLGVAGVAVGLSVGETTLGTTVGNLGFDTIEFPKPVFHGDTVYAETEVVGKRESKSRPQWGIVTFEHRARNQHGEVVMVARRNAMMRKTTA